MPQPLPRLAEWLCAPAHNCVRVYAAPRPLPLQVIRSLLDVDKFVIVVEHDLSVLDYLSDFICCLYGKPGAYGVVTLPFSVRWAGDGEGGRRGPGSRCGDGAGPGCGC